MVTDSKRRGFSISELLVAAGLTALVITLCLQLFVPSLWLFQKEQAATEAHRSALVVLNRISRELFETTPETVRLVADGSHCALSFVPVSGSGPTGRLLFDKGGYRIFAYRADRKQVMAWFYKPASPGPDNYPNTEDPAEAPQLTTLELLPMLQSPPDHQVLARYVSEFRLGQPNEDISNPHYPLRLAVTVTVPQDRPSPGQPLEEKVHLETRIFPRCMRP